MSDLYTDGSAARALETPSYKQLIRDGKNYPQYRLRYGQNWAEVWQVPAECTFIEKPLRIGGLKGHKYEFAQGMIIRWLRKCDAKLEDKEGEIFIDEDAAVHLGLLFRALAPMRRAEKMIDVARAIDDMNDSESAYWLGMSMHRFNPRRTLAALRMLLTNP